MAIAVTHDEPRPGQILDSHNPRAGGTMRSSLPYHSRTGLVTALRSKSHSPIQETLSQPAPPVPCRSASRIVSSYAAPIRGSCHSSLSRDDSRFRSSKAATTPGPPDTRNTSASGSIPAANADAAPAGSPGSSDSAERSLSSRVSSAPGTSWNGATPWAIPARLTRPPGTAAAASAPGPPPDQPSVANRSTASSSAIAAHPRQSRQARTARRWNRHSQAGRRKQAGHRAWPRAARQSKGPAGKPGSHENTSPRRRRVHPRHGPAPPARPGLCRTRARDNDNGVPYRRGSSQSQGVEHLIRRSGHVVQDRPSPVVGWADIPELSTCVGCCSAAWLQSWLQSRRNGADPRPSAFQA